MTEKRRFDLVRIDPADGPIYLLVDAMDVDAETAEYIYDEGTCPSNVMRSVCEVIVDGETDPHGLIEYVRTVEVEGYEKAHSPRELWRPVVPEAFSEDEG